MKKNQKNTKNKSVGRAREGAQRERHPPAIQNTNTVHRVFRFKAAAAGSNTISVTSILDLLEMATSTTVAYRQIDAFKIKRFRVWGPPDPASAVPSLVKFEWFNTSSSFGQKIDQSMGVLPGYIEASPPRGDLAFWIGSGSSLGTICAITGPAGTIVDLEITVRDIHDVAGTLATNSNGTALVVGSTYVNFLDGTAKNLVAQGVLTPV